MFMTFSANMAANFWVLDEFRPEFLKCPKITIILGIFVHIFVESIN